MTGLFHPTEARHGHAQATMAKSLCGRECALARQIPRLPADGQLRGPVQVLILIDKVDVSLRGADVPVPEQLGKRGDIADFQQRACGVHMPTAVPFDGIWQARSLPEIPEPLSQGRRLPGSTAAVEPHEPLIAALPAQDPEQQLYQYGIEPDLAGSVTCPSGLVFVENYGVGIDVDMLPFEFPQLLLPDSRKADEDDQPTQIRRRGQEQGSILTVGPIPALSSHRHAQPSERVAFNQPDLDCGIERPLEAAHPSPARIGGPDARLRIEELDYLEGPALSYGKVSESSREQGPDSGAFPESNRGRSRPNAVVSVPVDHLANGKWMGSNGIGAEHPHGHSPFGNGVKVKSQEGRDAQGHGGTQRRRAFHFRRQNRKGNTVQTYTGAARALIVDTQV